MVKITALQLCRLVIQSKTEFRKTRHVQLSYSTVLVLELKMLKWFPVKQLHCIIMFPKTCFVDPCENSVTMAPIKLDRESLKQHYFLMSISDIVFFCNTETLKIVLEKANFLINSTRTKRISV